MAKCVQVCRGAIGDSRVVTKEKCTPRNEKQKNHCDQKSTALVGTYLICINTTSGSAEVIVF